MLLAALALLAGAPLAGARPGSAPSGFAPALLAQDLGCERGDREVRALRFEGQAAVPAATLAAALATQPSSLAGVPGLGTRRCLDPVEFARDVQRIATLYRRRGFPDVRVDTVVTALRPGVIAVTFRIREGAPTRVAALALRGVGDDPVLGEAARDFPLVVGGLFDRGALEAGRDSLLRRLRNRGWPQAEVLLAYTTDEAARTAEVEVLVVPGVRARLGRITLQVEAPGGARRVSDATIRRALALRPGEWYSARAIIDAQRNLYQTDAFQRVELLPDSLQPAGDSIVHLTARLVEGDRWVASGGLGWATLDCFRMQGALTDRDFLPMAQRLELTGRVSKVGMGAPLNGAPGLCQGQALADPYSRTLNYYTAVTVRQPVRVASPRVPSLTLFSSTLSEYKAFLRRTPIGGALSVTNPFGARAAGTATYQVELGRTEAEPAFFCAVFNACDPDARAFLQRNTRLAAAELTVARERAPDPFRGRGGHALRLNVRHASTLIGSDDSQQFNRATGDASWTLPLRGGGTLVAHLRAGVVLGGGVRPSVGGFIPPQERLYAGGPTTVRGFRQNELGPAVYIVSGFRTVTADGRTTYEVDSATVVERVVPTGGNTLVVGNVELMWPSPVAPQLLQVAAFADAGRLWNRVGARGAPVLAGEAPALLVTPGLGIRVASPFGAIRVDLGYNPYRLPEGAAYFNAREQAGVAPLYCVSPGNGLRVTPAAAAGAPGAGGGRLPQQLPAAARERAAAAAQSQHLDRPGLLTGARMSPRRRTVVLATAGVLLALLTGMVGGAAALTRTDAGRALLRRALLPVLQAAIPGRLYVGALGGTFVTGLTVDSLEIRTPTGRPFLATGPIRVRWDPRDLLDRRIVVKALEVTRPVVELVDYGNDDWNWRRALQRGRRAAGPRGRGFGSYVRLDTATLREMTLVVRQPWALSDTLRGAKRDSALAFNLTRLDGEIRREEGRLARVYRFTRGTLALAHVRLADPDTAGQAFALRRMDVVWVLPPFWFREFSGAGRILGDTLWLEDVRFRLANSKAAGRAKAVWGSRLPMRYDVTLASDSVAFADLAWIHPTVPHAGGGSTRLAIRNDPRNLNVIAYALTDMDARALRSRLRGRMTYAVGGPVLAVNDVDLDLRPAHTDFLRWLNAEPFPYDWRGALTGRVAGRGGPITDWQLDEARLTFDDEHVPGARTVGGARGRVNLYTPAEAILKGMDVTIAQLDLRTPRFVNPNFAEVNGIVRGTMRLDSLWYDAWFSRADLEHVDGPGQPSRFTGGGRYTLVPEGVIVDVDLQAEPLNYTMLSRSYPTLPLRGQAVGRIQARGIGDDLAVQAALAGEGGEITFTGRADATDPRVAARGAWRLRGGNLQSLFGDNRYPVSNLNMAGRADIAWEFIPDAVGTVDGVVDLFSTVNAARVFGGQFRLTFDSGHVRVDTAAVESSALRLAARGGLGLVRGRPDTLAAVVDVDSLGGLRPWVTPADSGAPALVAPSAPLAGVATVRLQLAGTVDTLDPRGLALVARGELGDVTVGGTRAVRAAVALDVQDALRGATGTVVASADSAAVGGIPVSALAVRATLQGGLADRFTAAVRTANASRLQLAGGVTRQGDATRVRLDSLVVRVDSGGAPARGLMLAAPAVLALTPGGAVLDSLVLAHTDTGRLTVRAALAADSTVTARVVADRLPLGDVGRLVPLSRLDGGSASATVALAGTRERPRLEGSVALLEARRGGVRLGDLTLAAGYDTLRLGVTGALRLAGRTALEGSASLPLDLALLPRRTRRLEAPLAGQLRTVDGDLALLPELVPSVTEARGRLRTDVALTGSWARPRVRGGVRVDSGMVALGALGVRLERLRADIGLAADTIAIRTLAMESGAPGDSLALRGTVGITESANPTFDLTLAARAFQAVDRPRSASLVLTTTRPVTLTGSAEAPVLRGALRVDRGRVYIRALAQRRALDLAEGVEVVDTSRYGVNGLLPSAPGALMQALRLDDVRLAVGPDVWLRSPEANLKLGGGLRLTTAVARDGRPPRLALADSLVVERGSYQLNLGIARPGFDVERGVVRFFGDPDLEPALDITALHVVRETRLNSNRQDVRIRVLIGGTLDQPTLALRSADNPPLPESDMLSYLVTGEPAYALLGTPYADQGATLALRLAGSYLSSRLAGGRFDVVQVEPTALNPGEAANLRQSGLGILASTRVGVGGQVARNTFVTLSTGLCGLAAQGSGTADPLALFAQGLGAKLERRFEHGLSLSLGVEPGSSAQSCGRVGVSRTFQQTPPQFGLDLFRSWSFR